MAKLVSVNTSEKKGEIKTPVPEARVVKGYGIEGDVHAGSSVKQVSLLDSSAIREMERKADIELEPGDFAENLTTEGVDLDSMPVGKKVRVGSDVELEVSQIGKTCHDDCVIKEKTGDCIMPRQGLFFRVLEGGTVSPGDRIEPLDGRG